MTFVAGATLTAAELNDIINPPAVLAYGSANWMNWAASGSLYQTTWNQEQYDTAAIHSTGANTQRFTFSKCGVWEMVLNLRVNAPGGAWSTSGRINAEVRLNAGATVIKDLRANPNDANVESNPNWTFRYKFAAADYIEIFTGYFDGGIGSINPALISGAAYSSFSAQWIGTGD